MVLTKKELYGISFGASLTIVGFQIGNILGVMSATTQVVPAFNWFSFIVCIIFGIISIILFNKILKLDGVENNG